MERSGASPPNPSIIPGVSLERLGPFGAQLVRSVVPSYRVGTERSRLTAANRSSVRRCPSVSVGVTRVQCALQLAVLDGCRGDGSGCFACSFINWGLRSGFSSRKSNVNMFCHVGERLRRLNQRLISCGCFFFHLSLQQLLRSAQSSKDEQQFVSLSVSGLKNTLESV